MALLGSKVVVALDASAVAGGAVSIGLGGARLRSFARAPLEPGAIVPGPFEANIARSEDVREALGFVTRSLAAAGRRVLVVLPDGVARTALLDAPQGVVPREYARFRVTQGLPYPGPEALVEALSLGGRRFLGAAVRRSVVEEYESVVAGAGLRQARLDLAPLAALAGPLRPPVGLAGVAVILGDAALSIAAFAHDALRVFRSRRRDLGPDESQRLADEVERTAALAGEEPRMVRVVGAGAGALIRELLARGRAAAPGWQIESYGLPVEAAELAWLGAVLS